MLTLDATRPPERLAAEIAEAWDEDARMKIGITCYPTYGGSGAVATELGLELARRGHEVHFITYDLPFRLHGYTERIYFHQVDTRTGRYPLFDHFPYTLALASKQHEVVLREELEILHVHYAIPHATTAYLAREMLKGQQPAPRDHDAPRHRHHAGRPGVELLRHHPVLDRASRTRSPPSRRTCGTRPTAPSAA